MYTVIVRKLKYEDKIIATRPLYLNKTSVKINAGTGFETQLKYFYGIIYY